MDKAAETPEEYAARTAALEVEALSEQDVFQKNSDGAFNKLQPIFYASLKVYGAAETINAIGFLIGELAAYQDNIDKALASIYRVIKDSRDYCLNEKALREKADAEAAESVAKKEGEA